MKQLIFLLLSLFSYQSIKAQGADSLNWILAPGLNQADFLAEDSYYTKGTSPKTLEGSLYLQDNWVESRILTPEDEVVLAPARLRLFEEEMQVLQNGKVLALFPGKVKAVALGRSVFIPMNLGKNKGLSYLEVLVTGSMDLFVHHQLKLKKSDYNPALNVGSRNDRLVLVETYYYRSDEGNPRRLTTTRPGILKALNRRKKAVGEFAKANELRPGKRADLIALFEFYNRE